MPLSIGRDSNENSSWPASHSPLGPIFQAAVGVAASGAGAVAGAVADGVVDGVALAAGTVEEVAVCVVPGVLLAGPAHPANAAIVMTLTI
jgi:hypothetical protein